MMQDPIADLITRIRNAVRARKEAVEVRPASKLKAGICEILKREGYITDYEVHQDSRGGSIRIVLKYMPGGEPVLTQLQRVSKPSRRVYVDSRNIPWVKNGLGIAILSTSQGLMTDREARRRRIGGEVLIYAW